MQDAALRRNLTTSVNQQRGHNPAAPLGLFEAQFLGTVPVEQNTGQEVCDSAAESLLVRNGFSHHAKLTGEDETNIGGGAMKLASFSTPSFFLLLVLDFLSPISS